MYRLIDHITIPVSSTIFPLAAINFAGETESQYRHQRVACPIPLPSAKREHLQ